MADGDHDLLIRVDENVKDLKLSVSTLSKDHEGRIRVLESEKNRQQGALKAIYALLLLIATALGALWWVK